MSRGSSAVSFADAIWPAGLASRPLRAVLLVGLGSVLLTLSAKLQVPFYPVPMTLQTLVVLLMGMALGPRLALAAVLVYLAQGALGLPVFAGTPEKGLGLAYMAGPTGGYLAGFALAAWVTGKLLEHHRTVLGLVAAVVAGTAAIYLPGIAWLAALIGFDQALALGLVPFLLGDLLKGGIAIAAGLAGAGLMRRRPGV